MPQRQPRIGGVGARGGEDWGGGNGQPTEGNLSTNQRSVIKNTVYGKMQKEGTQIINLILINCKCGMIAENGFVFPRDSITSFLSLFNLMDRDLEGPLITVQASKRR